MKKLKLATKIMIGTTVFAAVGVTAGICLTVTNKTPDPLKYNQEVNVKKYTAGSTKSSQSFLSFPHNYHSMDYEYQKLYWVDVSKENIKDPKYDEGTDSFVPVHLNDTDITLDRFTNLYYPKATVISLYSKGATEGAAYTGEGSFKDNSVLTSWTSQNGFAYISDLDVALDTDAERKEYKETVTEEIYNQKIDEYDKANTFLNVFAGSRDVASYFFSGISQKLKDGDTLEGQPVTIENAKVTKSSIVKFAEWLISSATASDSIVLDLSQLYLTDLDRDNSVLALLNPQLWEYLMTYMEGSAAESRSQKYISKIDLSYNNLRVVPNIASIRTKNDDDWFWEAVVKVNKGQDNEHSGMNHIYTEGGGLVPLEYQQDGYFDGIDLSHNNLTYFDFTAYNPWNETYSSGLIPVYVCAGKSDRLKGGADGSLRTPSLVTLVKCRYEDYNSPIKYILDPTELKPVEEKLIGVNLDYNHLTWIMMNPLSEEAEKWKPEEHNNEPYVWWTPMLKSWDGIPLKDIGEHIGTTLPDYVFAYARSYLTYSTCITKTEVLGGIIPELEYVLGLGAYQTDGVNYTDNENYNFIMQNKDTYGKNLITTKKAAEITISEIKEINERYIKDYLNNVGRLISFPLYRSLTDINLLKIDPHWVSDLTTSDNIGGISITPINFTLARIKYLPEELNVDDDSSLNDIATKIFSTAAINYATTFEIPGFIKDYTAAIGVAVGLGSFALLIILIVIIKLASNVKHQFQYRQNELSIKLDESKKTKDKGRGKHGKEK